MIPNPSIQSLEQELLLYVSQQTQLPEHKVRATLGLFAQGSTIPFLARYRKEQTGCLDEEQLRAIEGQANQYKELSARRTTILQQLRTSNQWTPALQQAIMAATSKTALEDLYLPYKPKRRTKATIAQEQGLAPLADRLQQQPLQADLEQDVAQWQQQAQSNLSAQEALAGAQAIVAERLAEDPHIRQTLRTKWLNEAVLLSKGKTEASAQGNFRDYCDFSESAKTIPSHRFLAIRRGEREGALQIQWQIDVASCEEIMCTLGGWQPQSPYGALFRQTVTDSFRRLLRPSLETELRVTLKKRADQQAIAVFADNVRNVLLASPLGAKPVLAIDPGLRTGCKCVALSDTGRFLEGVVLHLVGSASQQEQASQTFQAWCERYKPHCIAIGNGTGSREAMGFAQGICQNFSPPIPVLMISEAGASVYSASPLAKEEFPDLDITLRGAISIGRRLQDPLAELVKIDPKAIGVGQYQHDVQQDLLQRQLEQVVESCVHQVGVELNTASAPLLAHVVGIGPQLAKRIVLHREEQGPFRSRQDLHQIYGLGQKAFEQAAGFLRIRNADHPLDNSGIHPESYAIVEQMAQDLALPLEQMLEQEQLLQGIDIHRYVGTLWGEPTLRDILKELAKPGRDPRTQWSPPPFSAHIHRIEQLQPGMAFEGIVSNVAAFGLFVDIGVHQDGLIHISQCANNYVQDAGQIAKVGDRIKVWILDVDVARKRIQLTARGQPKERLQPSKEGPQAGKQRAPSRPSPAGNPGKQAGFRHNPFANLRKS